MPEHRTDTMRFVGDPPPADVVQALLDDRISALADLSIGIFNPTDGQPSFVLHVIAEDGRAITVRTSLLGATFIERDIEALLSNPAVVKLLLADILRGHTSPRPRKPDADRAPPDPLTGGEVEVLRARFATLHHGERVLCDDMLTAAIAGDASAIRCCRISLSIDTPPQRQGDNRER